MVVFSTPNGSAPVTRPCVAEVVASDQRGQRFRFRADGILGRVIQHEVDHLDGMEFVDRMNDKTLLKSRDLYIAEEKMKPEHLVAQKINTKQYKKAY